MKYAQLLQSVMERIDNIQKTINVHEIYHELEDMKVKLQLVFEKERQKEIDDENTELFCWWRQ